MATGRTVQKWSKVYVDGYDLTGYSRTFGPLAWSVPEEDSTVLNDPVKNALPGQPMINTGTINAVLDNTTGASLDRFGTASSRVVMLPIGIRADPAAGDPVFMGYFMQKDSMSQAANGTAVTISAPFTQWAADASVLSYGIPWGVLVASKAARTAVNTSTGIDDRGAATALGGFMCYHLFSSNGTVTLKVQDAATNLDGSFSDLVSSGSINASVTPVANLVALGVTATVRRYLRWQLVFGTATTATFAIGFVRV